MSLCDSQGGQAFSGSYLWPLANKYLVLLGGSSSVLIRVCSAITAPVPAASPCLAVAALICVPT